MKISHFPDFLPDETVYSVCCRYLDRMQFRTHSTVSQHFFGMPEAGMTTELPSHLDRLLEALHPYHGYTVDMIIDQNTLFHFYAPFLSAERSTALQKNMRGNPRFIYKIAGIIKSKVSRVHWLRYCPVCIYHDRITYGECYWHRIHQIPGVLVCPVHEVTLKYSYVKTIKGDREIEFRSAESSASDAQESKVLVHSHTRLVQIANNAKWLLEQKMSVGKDYINQRYLELLADRGFLTTQGKLRYSTLKSAMLNYYSADLLEDLGCDIIKRHNNWLMLWKRMHYPLHHLLFIQFLCGTCQDFFTGPNTFSAYPDNGPWPCLNPFCPHYKKRVITSRTPKQAVSNIVATFTCKNCGFTYSRIGSDTNQYAGKVKQYGEIWKHHLTIYWTNKDISNAQLETLMHKDIRVLRRQAALLGLPFAPDLPRGKRPKVRQNIHQEGYKEKRDRHRSLWEEALKNHTNASMGEINERIKEVNKGVDTYAWLRKYDNGWFKQHRPDNSPIPTHKRFGQAQNQLKYESYSQSDASFAQSIRETREELLKKTGFPTRITRRILITKINDTAPLRKSNTAHGALPLTLNALDEMTETHTAFIWRKLRWAVQHLLNENNLPSYKKFLEAAHIGSRTILRPATRQLTQIAYDSLKAGTLLNDQMPDLWNKVTKETPGNIENIGIATNDSSAIACISVQMKPPYNIKQATRQVYKHTSIMLITIAAVLMGSDTSGAVARWGHQNEGSLHRFGVPEGTSPCASTLTEMYAKLDVDTFENTLEAWLLKTFPLERKENDSLMRSNKGIYIPGMRVLRTYRHIASKIIAKLC